MLVVPLQPIASQTVSTTLGGQNVTLNVYQKSTGLFIDVYVGGALIIGGVICLDAVLIVRSTYLGFTGDLAFFDTQGSDDPTYTGLGSRWVLIYLAPGDTSSAV